MFGADKASVKKKSDTEKLLWGDPVTEVKFDGSTRTYLMFEDAVYLDDTSLPTAIRKFKVGGASNTLQASLTQTLFEPLSELELSAVNGFFF